MLVSVQRKVRRGFTLVELMVAAAVSVGIMVILTVAFQTSINLMREGKAIGNLQERLRAATTVLSHDLAAEHFSGNFVSGVSGPYLSDQRLDKDEWRPPDRGFFRIWQGSAVNQPGYSVEALDADGIPSYVANNHMLHFTVKLQGNRTERLFATRLTNPGDHDAALRYTVPVDTITGEPDTTLAAFVADRRYELNQPGAVPFLSEWAEVIYCLEPVVDTNTGAQELTVGTDDQTTHLPLWSLRRRQRLPVRVAADKSSLHPPLPQWEEVSFQQPGDPQFLNNVADLTTPERRLQMDGATGRYPILGTTTGGDPFLFGDDILITDVISFQVQVHWSPHFDRTDPDNPIQTTPAPGEVNGGADLPFDDLPLSANPRFGGVAHVFDTWTDDAPAGAPRPNYRDDWNNFADPNAFTLPLRIRVRALKITIRVWDRKMKLARQATLVQEV